VSEDAKMWDTLNCLPDAVEHMIHGDPDEADSVKASDAVRWAIAEIARLREENRLLIEDRSRFPDKPDGIGRIIAAHNANREAKITDLENRCRDSLSEIARLREERDTLLESQLWGVACKPLPPGPEGDGNG